MKHKSDRLAAVFIAVAFLTVAWGCTSFSTTVFRLESTTATLGTNAVASFNAYYGASTNKAALEAPREQIYAASRAMAVHLSVVEAYRLAYQTNSAVKPQLEAALQAAVDTSSNIVWLVNWWKAQ